MSGPLSSLTQGLTQVAARNNDARLRQRLVRLAGNKMFTGLAHTPTQRHFGDFQNAKRLLEGTLQLVDAQVPLSQLTPWEVRLEGAAEEVQLHGFAWLDDFAALGGKSARAAAQRWVLGWLDRYAGGAGPGWHPSTAAHRLQRLLTHLPFLQKDLAEEAWIKLQGTLPVHFAYVGDAWPEEGHDLHRILTLSGWIHGAACLEGAQEQLPTALATLSNDLEVRVADPSTLADRNPSDQLAILQTLLDIRALLEDIKVHPPHALEVAVKRIAPALRLLRHGDGSLARFHGGGSGAEGALDRALAESRVRSRPTDAPALGYVRLHGGRVQLIVDCARPPERSDTAHASTLAFEMSSGRRPILVNCGPPSSRIEVLRRMPRTTAAHNTLALDKMSSSRFGPPRTAGRPGFDALLTRPSMVTLARAQDTSGMWIQSRHDGYLEDYGLLHERRLFIDTQGHQVLGEDVLLAPDQKAQRRFANRIKGAAKLGVSMTIHFHLHPDVEAEAVRRAEAVRLTLRSGEVWLFRAMGGEVSLATSIYCDPALPEPLPTRQIIINGRSTTHKAEVSWSLTHDGGAARATRDVAVTPLHLRQTAIDAPRTDGQ